MRIPWTLVVLMLVAATALAKNNNPFPTVTDDLWNEHTEAQIKERIANLDLPLQAKATDEVIARIRQYVTAGRKDTELMLGRTVNYFPIFEHYLEQQNLPDAMKYLPMIESGLRPTIKSSAGAAGIWQFMTITAKYNGLSVNAQIDQRLDPYASSAAAVKMLTFLHRQFNDWGLILAAYNSGHGRVKKAVQVAGSTDYWTVKNYLPLETQRYVPAFIAAAYVANYYSAHGLQPNMSATQTEDLRILQITRSLSFGEIAKATGMSRQEIQRLNPAYIQGYIPANPEGHALVLPATLTGAMRNYLKGEQKVLTKNAEVPTIYVVAKGDSLDKIAGLFNTTKEDIKKWNGITTDTITIHQELVLYITKSYLIKRA